MKRCSKCGEEKALPHFPRHRGRRDGLDSRCKECALIASMEYRRANLEKVREKDRARVHAIPIESRREKHRDWRERNRDYVREYSRVSARKAYARNPAKFRAAAKNYRASNLESCLEANRAYTKNLSDGYVASALRLPVSQVPGPLIEAKRVQLQIHRLLKEIKK